jgi:hypothetical protein
MPLPTPTVVATQATQSTGSGIPAPPGIPTPPDAGAHIPPPPGTIPEQGLPYVSGPATLHTRVNGDDTLLHMLLSQLVGHDIPVYGFEEVTGNLEDIFLRTTKGLVQ